MLLALTIHAWKCFDLGWNFSFDFPLSKKWKSLLTTNDTQHFWQDLPIRDFIKTGLCVFGPLPNLYLFFYYQMAATRRSFCLWPFGLKLRLTHLNNHCQTFTPYGASPLSATRSNTFCPLLPTVAQPHLKSDPFRKHQWVPFVCPALCSY